MVLPQCQYECQHEYINVLTPAQTNNKSMVKETNLQAV